VPHAQKLDKDGGVIMLEDTATKGGLGELREQRVKDSAKFMQLYHSGLKAMSPIVMGQLDGSITQGLQVAADWEDIKAASNTVKMLEMLRDICYQGAKTKIHPATNLIRALRKLVTGRQCGDPLSGPAGYVQGMRECFEVFKSVHPTWLNVLEQRCAGP